MTRRPPAGVSRRQALSELGSAGASLLLGPTMTWRPPGLQVAGRAAEVAVAAVSPATLRVSVLDAAQTGTQPIPLDGALVEPTWSPQVRLAHTSARTADVGAFRIRVAGAQMTSFVARPHRRPT